ncbi:ATP-binding protein [Leptothrix discophora]|uniref:histidine kinase n=1 Tax=Leptothrix discophora TaxID=89 RepID=A0ABT9G2B4_LEPDI|nr:ATP-binding protein [Leptothrix discophora]MDP4300551.1 ATP-binding protein [Leptothrix discophora]
MTARRFNQSLQQGLQWRVLGAVVALWAAVAATTWYRMSEQVDDLLDGHLAQGMALLMALQVQDHEFDEMLTADHIAVDEGTPDGRPPQWSGTDAAELALHKYATKAVFQVWYQGQLLLKSTDAPTAPLAELKPGFSDTNVKGVAWRVYTAPAVRPDSYVIMAESIEARHDIVNAVLRDSWLPLIAGLPLLAFAIWLAVRQGLVPLNRLGAQVSARKPEALDPIDADESPRELAPLIQALNQLFVRMRNSLESERRFTSDAAHELRTPIAGIRAQAQAALTVNDRHERHQALIGTLEGCDHAARLVDQLLQLARLEGARANGEVHRQVVDVLAVAREEVVEAAAATFESGHELVLETDPDHAGAWALAADPVLLGILLRNLIDNALRYSPAGSTVQVTLAGPDAQGRLSVSVDDSGPGLPPALMQRLGERFFRARQNDAPGSGLGWSIVRRIARAFELEVQVGRSSTWGGLRVTLSWPHVPARVLPGSVPAEAEAVASTPPSRAVMPSEPLVGLTIDERDWVI